MKNQTRDSGPFDIDISQASALLGVFRRTCHFWKETYLEVNIYSLKIQLFNIILANKVIKKNVVGI